VTSSTEKRSVSKSASNYHVKQRMTDAVVDAKLAGLTQEAMTKVFQDVLATFFKTA
jgi:hypothetical protein